MTGSPASTLPKPGRLRRPLQHALMLSVLLLAGQQAAAQAVALTGVLGHKALLVVDGAPPRGVAVGDSLQGVTVVSVGEDSAVVEIAHQRQTLRLGEAPVRVGSAKPREGSGKTVTLTSDSAGHFKGLGSLNGQQMQFVVDTGATLVSISRADADRMGISYQGGRPLGMSTANGLVQGWSLKLDSVRVGDVEVFGVEAVVTPTPMPYVLLGNSFLDRFQMRRVNDQMVLEKKP